MYQRVFDVASVGVEIVEIIFIFDKLPGTGFKFFLLGKIMKLWYFYYNGIFIKNREKKVMK